MPSILGFAVVSGRAVQLEVWWYERWIPGELLGLELAHRRHGVLPWEAVVTPAVSRPNRVDELCYENGLIHLMPIGLSRNGYGSKISL